MDSVLGAVLQSNEPGPDVMRNLVPDVAEYAQTCLADPSCLGGIIKRPIESLERERVEARTVFLRRVAHDNGVIDTHPAEKAVEALGMSSLGSRPVSVRTWRVSGCTWVGSRPALRTSKRSPA